MNTNRLEISTDGVHADDGLAEHRLKWGNFHKYRETENLLLLITVDDVPCIVAKRAVADERTMNELRKLISDNIAEGEFAKKQNAFAVIVGGG